MKKIKPTAIRKKKRQKPNENQKTEHDKMQKVLKS